MTSRLLLTLLPLALAASPAHAGDVLTGKQALGDWTTDAPGVRRKITLDDLATPFETPSAQNFPRVVRRPEGAWPKAPRDSSSPSSPRSSSSPASSSAPPTAISSSPRAAPTASTSCATPTATASPK